MKNVFKHYYIHILMYEAGTKTWTKADINKLIIADET